MLLDLRVVLAVCLATLVFLIAGFGLAAIYRPPFQAASGPAFSGPGLPSARPLPVTMPVSEPHRPLTEAESVQEAKRILQVEPEPKVEAVFVARPLPDSPPAFETIEAGPTVTAKSAIEAKATIGDLLARAETEQEITGSVKHEPVEPPSPAAMPAPAATNAAPASAPASALASASPSEPALSSAPPPSAVLPVIAPLPVPAPPPAVRQARKIPRAVRGRTHHGHSHGHGRSPGAIVSPGAAAAAPVDARPALQPRKRRHRARHTKKQNAPPPSNNPFASWMNRNSPATR